MYYFSRHSVCRPHRGCLHQRFRAHDGVTQLSGPCQLPWTSGVMWCRMLTASSMAAGLGTAFNAACTQHARAWPAAWPCKMAPVVCSWCVPLCWDVCWRQLRCPQQCVCGNIGSYRKLSVRHPVRFLQQQARCAARAFKCKAAPGRPTTSRPCCCCFTLLRRPLPHRHECTLSAHVLRKQDGRRLDG